MKEIPVNKKSKILTILAMLLLALNPILSWYKIPFPLSLGPALMLGMSIVGIAARRFSFRVLPISFYAVFIYVSFKWTLDHGLQLWTLFPPGGVLFFNFILALISGILLFDIDYLKKIMMAVVFISIPLFWIQMFLLYSSGTHICFVPNLTGHFTYQDYSYSELRAVHLASQHPCSIFIEKSYMAYYLVSYLCLELFGKSNQNRFFSFQAALIVVTLLALRSGSGIVGLAVLLLIKAYKMFWGNSSLPKRIFMMIIGIPLVWGVFVFCTSTEAGGEIIGRSAELTTEGTSGYSRVVQGFVIYENLPSVNKITGMQRNDVISYSEKSYNTDDRLYVNGVQEILITLGILGMLIYLIFYIEIFRKSEETGKMSIIALLVIALLESCYLNPYMILLTVIPCAQIYYNQRTSLIYK